MFYDGAEVSWPEPGRANMIGVQIRSLRRARKLTLEELAGSSGLNKGYLSRIERGEKSPSVATVVKLAEVLEVSVATLFGEKIEDTEIHLVRADSRTMLELPASNGAYPFAALSKPSGDRKIESFVIYPPTTFGSEGYINHNGEEVFFVLKGKIEMSLVDRNISLNEGDYLQFPGHLKHRVRKVSRSAAALVVIALG
jgi:transcriptional regulator with XRE-family HTH domain